MHCSHATAYETLRKADANAGGLDAAWQAIRFKTDRSAGFFFGLYPPRCKDGRLHVWEKFMNVSRGVSC